MEKSILLEKTKRSQLVAMAIIFTINGVILMFGDDLVQVRWVVGSAMILLSVLYLIYSFIAYSTKSQYSAKARITDNSIELKTSFWKPLITIQWADIENIQLGNFQVRFELTSDSRLVQYDTNADRSIELKQLLRELDNIISNMTNRFTVFCLIFFSLVACKTKEEPNISSFKVFCEMVSSEAKPLALSYPMDPEVLNDNLMKFESIAEEYNVQIFKEDSLPSTWLFPSEATQGKSVVIIYIGDRLTQYQQFKTDWAETPKEDSLAQLALARRFGRLLGYSLKGINQLLSNNTYYNTLSTFGIDKQITHLYYDSLSHAINFYKTVLGLTQIDSNTFQISNDAFIRLNPTSEKHPSGQPKSTAIALLTDQLPEWYKHIQSEEVEIKYTYKPGYNPAHDGFVAIDPEGYLLEFEMFKQHPENELFMAKLENAPRVETSVDGLNFYGSITWTYHKDLLKMQNFYEQELGFQLVADQGWTKIYQTSSSGFIGLVDERRGMEDFADKKAIEIEWKLKQSGFSEYASRHWKNYSFDGNSFTGPENYIYRVTN